MKIIRRSLSMLLLAGLMLPVLHTLAASGTQNWYFKKNENHEQPPLDTQLQYTEELNAYYVDKKAKADDPVLYLTFDAGYENGNIEKILDALKKHNARAAFFVLSHLVQNNTDLIVRMHEEGHIVCNHTASHKDMSKVTDFASFEAELKKMEEICLSCSGVTMSKYYRPPEGKFTRENLEFAKRMGYSTIFWSFAYADWDNNKQPSPEAAIENIVKHTHNGAVILLHPTSATNAQIMDKLLTAWEKEGYRFGTLDELTGKKTD